MQPVHLLEPLTRAPARVSYGVVSHDLHKVFVRV